MYEWIVGSWRSLGFVALSTVLIYGSVVLGLRVGERRTLTELTAYDFAVAVALGSIIGRTATEPRPSYVQGLTAMVVLIASHQALSWARARSTRVRHVIERPPLPLIVDGQVDDAGLARARVVRDDLDVVLREHGLTDAGQVRLLVLEPRGAFSVVTSDGGRAEADQHRAGP